MNAVTLADPSAILVRYQEAFAQTWTDATPVERVRFVAFDTESTGIDPKRDALVSIGAVTVQGNEIRLEDAFEAMLKVRYNNAMVVIHGITREESLKGLDEEEALVEFLDYLGDAVLVGHHATHDIDMLNEALTRHFGVTLRNRSLDVMELTIQLERGGVLWPADRGDDFSLDTLCTRFGVLPHDRHTAHGDAFLTAQIFLKLARLAGRSGRSTLGSILPPPTSRTD